MYNKTWRYKYYNLRQSISIWLEAKITIYYRNNKHSKFAQKLYVSNMVNSSVWFHKICDLINEINGPPVNFVFYGKNDKRNHILHS